MFLSLGNLELKLRLPSLWRPSLFFASLRLLIQNGSAVGSALSEAFEDACLLRPMEEVKDEGSGMTILGVKTLEQSWISPLLNALLRALAEDTHIRIKDLPAQDRPRERLLAAGADSLRNSELLAIILRTGSRGASAVDIAERLLHQFGTLEKLARAPLADLQNVRGIGRDKAIALKSAFTLAQRMAQEVRMDSPPFDKPEIVADFLREETRLRDVEMFYVLLLNTRRRLIRSERISIGLLDQILVHPREVFRHAVGANASAIVLAHNHPSGDPTPSEADIRATRDLIRAGQVLRIEVLDHVILGTRSNNQPRDYVSLRELGYFQ